MFSTLFDSIGVMINNAYQKKINSCLSAIHQIGFDLQSIKVKYGNENFLNSDVSKFELFNSVLSQELHSVHIDFLIKKCSLTYLKDKRTPFEYGIDLILGWILEDAVYQKLYEAGFDLNLSGNDSQREFLAVKNISSQPDIQIQTIPPKSLEIFADWKGTWRKYGHADLRDNKFQSLKNKEAYLLGISPINSEGFLIDFSSQSNLFEYVSAIWGYGNKPGYSCGSIKTQLKPLNETLSNLIENLHKSS